MNSRLLTNLIILLKFDLPTIMIVIIKRRSRRGNWGNRLPPILKEKNFTSLFDKKIFYNVVYFVKKNRCKTFVGFQSSKVFDSHFYSHGKREIFRGRVPGRLGYRFGTLKKNFLYLYMLTNNCIIFSD